MDMDNQSTLGVPAPEAVAILLSSPLFDPGFYAREQAIDGTPAVLAAHYLSIGEAQASRPSPGFDPRFYRDNYPDIARSGGSPLEHFIRHGRLEGRYAHHAQLKRDAALIAASGLFDARAYAWNRGRAQAPGLTAIEDYLVARNPAVPVGDAFDSALYLRLYPDVPDSHVLPLLHYLEIGRFEYRVPTQKALDDRREAVRPRFRERYYLSQLPSGTDVDDPLDHYLLHGARTGLDPAPDFSHDYYVRFYDDIRTGPLDPFYHFAAFGHAEGRAGRPEFTTAISPGALAFDPARPTVLVASHEASRSGAPLVGLNIGMRLAASHNVITYVGHGGTLLDAFAEHSCLVVNCRLTPLTAEFLLRDLMTSHRLEAVLLNSVETDPLAAAALHTGLPSVALVHEFAEYTLPRGRSSSVIESVDRVMAPAKLIHDSLQKELAFTRSGHASNIAVRAQGYLPQLPRDEAGTDMSREEILAYAQIPPGARYPIVLGAGFVHMRKGVDLFVQTAAEVRRRYGDEVRFLWVGAGYTPLADLNYTFWLGDMVERLDLSRIVHFVPIQGSLDTLFALADVFFLPSRLDPFPNVALDALRAGRSIVCFDNATGIADLLRSGPAVGAAVTYCSEAAAAEALIRAFDPAEKTRALRNAALAEQMFSFADYMLALTTELARARTERRALDDAVARIGKTGLFDAAFHDGVARLGDTGHARRAMREYAARGQKGLLLYNPRPGFNEGAARAAGIAGPALGAAGAPAQTHSCIGLDDLDGMRPFTGRILLHLHLHYPELADAFHADLTAAGARADLLVTTTSEERRLEVSYALRRYRGGSLTVVTVPNRGRDIGPFLTQVGSCLADGGYDIVGHLHGKRSMGVDVAMGSRWRIYLTDVLLGGTGGLGRVLAPFAADPGLGLIFPEDRHAVGWTDNHAVALSLAARMTPAPAVPAWPIFPMGSMFWARPAALAPLLGMTLSPDELPREPVPYDGTILHAIERLLPSVAEAAGFRWATIFRQGVSR